MQIKVRRNAHHCFIFLSKHFFKYLYRIDCGDLETPVNGSVFVDFGTTFKQVVRYVCEKGFEIVGNHSRQCSANGTWTEEAPVCIIKGSLVT